MRSLTRGGGWPLAAIILLIPVISVAGRCLRSATPTATPLGKYLLSGYQGSPEMEGDVLSALHADGISDDEGIPLFVSDAEIRHIDENGIRVAVHIRVVLVDGSAEWKGVGWASFHYEGRDGEDFVRPHAVAKRLATRRAVGDLINCRRLIIRRLPEDDIN